MELRTVNTFLRVAELQSFSKAAAELEYSQSAVTVQVKQLEEELGVQLFERIGKRVTMTDKGQRFIPYAKKLIRSAQEAKNSIRSEEEICGVLRIGTIDSLSTNVFPAIMEEYHRRYPMVSLVMRTGDTFGLQEMLKQNQVDLVYTLNNKLYDTELVHAYDKEEAMQFICPVRHPLAGRTDVALTELAEEQFVLTEQGQAYRYELEKLLSAVKREIKVTLEVGNTDLIRALVARGMGISLLPYYAVQEALARREIAAFSLKDASMAANWSQLLYHRNKWMTEAMSKLIDLIIEMREQEK